MSVKNVGSELSRNVFGLGSETMAADALIVNPFGRHIAKTTGGDAEALTLADATPGTLLYIYIITDGGGDATMTPVTSTGWTALIFGQDGDAVLLLYVDDTIGWILLSALGAAIDPTFTAAD